MENQAEGKAAPVSDAPIRPQASEPSRIGREILHLAWPGALTLLLDNMYRANDLFWVKWLGREAQAAVSVAGMVTILTFAFYGGLATGTLSLSARLQGAGHAFRVRRILRISLVSSLATGLLVALLGMVFMEDLLPWLVPESPGLPRASLLLEREALRAYLEPIFLGGFFLCTASVVEQTFLSMRDMKTPLLLQLCAVLLNCVLNPLLVFGLGPLEGMGTAGAGLATIASRAFVSFLGILLLQRRLPRRGSPDPRSTRTLLREFCRIGLPIFSAIGMYSVVYQVILHTSFAPFGAKGRAALGTGFVLEGLAFCLIWGLAMATGSLAARNLGAGRADLADRVVALSVRFVLCLTLPLTLLFLLAPHPLASLLASDAGVKTEVVTYLRCLAFSQFAVGLQAVYEESMISAGHSLPVSLTSVFWNTSRIPMAWLMAHPLQLGLPGIWWAINLSSFGRALTARWILGRGRWRRTGI